MGRAVTMADVAQRAGVSRALVSIVIRGVPGASEANRARVLQAAADLDFHPDQRARLLGSSRSRTIGVVLGIDHAFHAQLVADLYASVAATGGGGAGWRLAVEPVASSRPEREALRALVDQRCEAALLLGPGSSTAELAALARRLPLVLLARRVTDPEIRTVRTDDEAGARLAVEHLLALGHRRIAHLHGGRAPGAAERRAGYRRAMAAAGLEPELLAGGLDDAAGERAAPEVLRPGGPTAVLAFNDACALGLLLTARAQGVEVPRRLSIVGFDDSVVARSTTVALTTVAQDSAAIAAHGLRLAVEAADGEPGVGEAGGGKAGSGEVARPGTDGRARQVVIAPRLVVRRTTAPPPGPDETG
ncbi:LacI family DNA-binding transcriptional regulator [Kineococcus gynurae]|uniref:LacI family DNA-binding transcriptional regulator n=1 Tax=Kineococcus gynurae TaxID=452979 RepID=A0ABV5LW93_9ACTN